MNKKRMYLTQTIAIITSEQQLSHPNFSDIQRLFNGIFLYEKHAGENSEKIHTF